MSEQEPKKHGGESRSAETNGIEVRPRNWLVPVVLLSLREWNTYGYKLMEQAAAFGFGAMNPGTLYRTLRHMERDGLCESEWDTSNGRGPAPLEGAGCLYSPTCREGHSRKLTLS